MYQAQTNIPDNFGGLAETLFDQLPKEARVHFVTDSYYPYSVKGLERSRRGSGTVHLIKGSSTKVPRNWKTFLSNDENKQNPTKFLLDEWKQDKYATKLKGRQIMFVCGDHCTCLLSADGLTTLSESVEELCSTQEEADTKIVLHCLNASKVSSKETTITVRSPDTDIFILLLFFAERIQKDILFDTWRGNNRRLLDVKKIAKHTGEEICAILPAVHAYSGCDTTSAFVRKGKISHIKILKKHPEFQVAFAKLGATEDLDNTALAELEHFACLLYDLPSDDIN